MGKIEERRSRRDCLNVYVTYQTTASRVPAQPNTRSHAPQRADRVCQTLGEGPVGVFTTGKRQAVTYMEQQTACLARFSPFRSVIHV